MILSITLVSLPEICIARTYDYIYINADGSIDPITAPIQRSENIYTLLGNTSISLIIKKDNIVLDGAGFTLEGPGFGDSPPRINMTAISNLTITNMVIRGPNHGIVMSTCSNITIIENDIEIRLGKTGVRLKSSSNISITDNRIIGELAAIELSMSSNNTIDGNYLSTYTGHNGVLLYNSTNNNIIRNFLYSNTCGVNLYYSSGNNIIDNNLTSHWTSIALESSSNNQIVGNIMEDHRRMTYDVGFQMNNSDNNAFVRNTIRDSQRCIQIDYSSNNTLENNTITGNSITDTNSWGIRLTESSNSTVIGNHIELVINNENYPGIIFGILLGHSSRNLIISNNVTYYEWGLGLTSSHNNTISDNLIANNFRGLDLTASENNTVSGNYITNNTDGIALENMYNAIFGNIITNNSNFGIFLYGAGYNNLIGNNITDNGRGILVSICYDNVIHHNNFVNNTNHVETDNSNGVWDNGEEGNYWDNYTGLDSDSDGIGDIPYILDENNQDNYPLMNPVDITVIPEFSSLISLLPSFLIVIAGIVVFKRKMSNLN
jgi:parallel beta-helix repeat protein